MRIAIVDTYYPRFISSLYATGSSLANESHATQLSCLLAQAFGTSDFYSDNLRSLGVEANDLIVNCLQLQSAWARENKVPFFPWALKLPRRSFRIPAVGPWLASLPGLIDIALAQIRQLRPDILYCQDLSFFPPAILRQLKEEVRLIVGQIACPLPSADYLREYDLILTSFPHFVPRLRDIGVKADYLRIAFDPRVLKLIGRQDRIHPASFVGGISPHHGNALPLLEHLATTTPIEFFGYGAHSLSRNSPIVNRHRGEVWGLDMYRVLASSAIAVNRHIDVAENNANNMRLYEATGVGSMLITDRKDNLHELFSLDKEVVVYSSKEEASELINYFVEHPHEAAIIAAAGQQRTLADHTYLQRMHELVPILDSYLAQ